VEAYLLDWGNLLLRWLHVIAAIAWIGSSFYFVFLDNSLEPPADDALKAKGVTGEMWAVHGGGFYNPQKYALGPKVMPPNKLHWFYWESYATWLSGFALFVLMYLWNANVFLVDTNVHAWPSNGWAIAAALAFLIAGWIVYDLVCRVFGRNKDGSIGGDLRVGLLILAFVVFASWLACELFAGRAAFLVVGAMLGTIMSANVAHWIIPGQRKVVADIAAGRTPDPIHGQRGKQRSVHNTYFTLPVLVAMLGNHYPMLYQREHNWVVLVALMLLGALVRQFFVLRHKGASRWELVVASAAIVAGLVVFIAPPRSATAEAQSASPAQVQAIVQQRCVMCHNPELAQKGVMLHTPELVAKNAQAIYQQVVVTRQMPLNNSTQITEAERVLIARWFAAAASPLPEHR
jgi:uncharacterized membrane protein